MKNIIVKTYKSLGDFEPGQEFMSRAIAVSKGKSEGFSICFYAPTEEHAKHKAEAWIESERVKQEEIVRNREIAAEKTKAKRAA